MSRKIILPIVLSVFLVILMVGCSGKSENSSNGSSGDTVIKMMHLWPEGSNSAQSKAVDQIIKEYETAHSNVTIKTEVLDNEQYKSKLKVLSSSNSLPDVGFTWSEGFLDPYVKGQMFAPLDDLLQGDLNGKFVAGTTEAYAVDGKTYGLPVELNIVPVFYNKEIFQKYGLSAPKTLDDLNNIIDVLNKNGVTPIALGGKDGWTSSFWYMYLAERLGGPDLLDKAVASNNFMDPVLIKAGELSQNMVDSNAFEKGFNGLSNDEAKAEFMNEKAAMYAMGTWEVPNYTTASDVPQAFKDKIGYFKFPAISGGKGTENEWVGGPGVGLFVAENSKVKDQAKDFVKFFVEKWGEISVTQAGIIPATKVDTSSVKLPQMFIDLLNELNSAKKVVSYLDVQMKPLASDEHHKLVQALFGKQLKPEQFAQKQDAALKTGK